MGTAKTQHYRRVGTIFVPTRSALGHSRVGTKNVPTLPEN
jgi:hypothetical protein